MFKAKKYFGINSFKIYKFENMNTQQIKSLLHESIENINDAALLLAVKEMLDHQYTPKAVPELSQWQLNRIEESKKQIEEGKSYTAKEADDIADQWLNE